MAKYVSCAYCGRRINFGELAYGIEHDAYCSEHCFAARYYVILDENKAKQMRLQILDDEVRAKELRDSIEKAKRNLQLMELELADITGDHTEYLDLMQIGKRKETQT